MSEFQDDESVGIDLVWEKWIESRFSLYYSDFVETGDC